MPYVIIPGLGPHIDMVDANGCRQVIKTQAISGYGDADEIGSECYVYAYGRAMKFNVPLRVVLEEITEAQLRFVGG